ncbi:asparagine synthase (glutamine-hydrolyzing), partial [bacterium]|nr:asparagine synthase (glutamine-hydrolyzing) [bacterium]
MCGITGKVFFSKGRNISDVEIKNMTDTIIHRGPNDSGIYTDKNIGLGFRRLSIIDLHTGHQPLSNEDDSIWIVFNGEIYNFMELRQTLVSKGHRFKTKTDTEVIIHLYEEFGVDCVKQLRGMFAFVIWDSKKQQIFCARDRFGIKPFYYFIDNEKFIFGSEIKSIKASNDINFQLNIFALDAYFTYGYTIGEQTIFEGIKKLRPSHTLLLKLNENFPKPIISRYWQINFDTDYSKTEEDWCKEIQNVLSESVKMHLVSDVPIGAFLSGGIDSSSVVALMAKNVTGRIKTFSIGFKEQDFSELD